MRLLPPIVICLALLPGCKTDPIDPGEVEAELVDEDQFAAKAAETLCAQLFACECGDSPFTVETEPLPWASEAECVADKQPEFQQLLDAALVTGGSYSPKCGGEQIADLLRPDCESLWDFRVGGGRFVDTQVCPLVIAERQVGEPCEPFMANLNDCGEGMLCTYDFLCVESGELPVQKGGACEIENVDVPCAPGLFCAYQNEGPPICVEPFELGDPCPNYSCFGADLSCDYETMTCIANAGEGESCESVSCSAGLYCDGGQANTCVAQYEFGHGCANDSVCAHGGVCVNSICTPPEPAVCNFD